MCKKVLVVGSSKLPIPAVLGGAVPNLIEELIAQNEKEACLDMQCCSLYHPLAEKAAKKYGRTQFIWIKSPIFIQWADAFLYWMMKYILRQQRLLSLRSVVRTIWFQFSLALLLRRQKYDFVIFENSIPLLTALKFFGNFHKYQDAYFVHMHSVPRHYFRNVKLFENSKKIICVSDYVAQAILQDPRLSLPKEKMAVMYNCMDTTLFNPTPCATVSRQSLGLADNEPVILFVGRLCPEKGIEELLNAFALLQTPHVHLLVVGSNFYKSDIVSSYEKKLCQIAQPFADRIHFTGYISYEQMPAVYKLADIVVLPSMWEEPAGMTILEAMACQKAVITTYSGGIAEYTGKDNCILLKRDGQLISHLAQQIDRLLADPSYCEQLAQRAARRAVAYNQAFYYQQFLQILQVGESHAK